MKYSFMSFSCPEGSIGEMLQMASKYGYNGIELRTGERKHKHGVELDAAQGFISDVRKKIENSGLEISCLATGCSYADMSSYEENIKSTLEYIDLASRAGSPTIRVFGGYIPANVTRRDSIRHVADCLKRIASFAEKKGVIVCLETHDDWCDPAHVAEVMQLVENPMIKVNWDIMHPVWRADKSVDDSFAILKQWIGHVHFHDGIRDKNGKSDWAPVGKGSIDHRRAVQLLMGISYKGYLSGEWSGWQEPSFVHLPREINTMRGYEKALL